MIHQVQNQNTKPINQKEDDHKMLNLRNFRQKFMQDI